jgi:ABC-type antimicrobial peptide transport system permease subunit
MNIMLISVTERTREISRTAVGARHRFDIVWRFLSEALGLAGIDGLLAMMFGWPVLQAARLAFPELPTAEVVRTVLLGVLASVGTGLFFGI